MLTTYEQRLVLTYLANAVSRLHRDSPEARELAGWVSENADRMGLATPAIELCQKRPRCRKPKSGLSKGQCADLRTLLMDGRHAGTQSVRGDRLELRLRSLGCEMQLSRTDVAILKILLRYRSNPVVESLIDGVFEEGRHVRRHMKIFNLNRASPISRATRSTPTYSSLKSPRCRRRNSPPRARRTYPSRRHRSAP